MTPGETFLLPGLDDHLGGQMKQKAPLSPVLLDRIRHSAEDGDMPTEAYAVLREHGFVP